MSSPLFATSLVHITPLSFFLSLTLPQCFSVPRLTIVLGPIPSSVSLPCSRNDLIVLVKMSFLLRWRSIWTRQSNSRVLLLPDRTTLDVFFSSFFSYGMCYFPVTPFVFSGCSLSRA